MIARPAPDPAAVAALLTAGAGEQIVFAAANVSPAKLAESLAALANAHGGTLVLGVSAHGRPIGVSDADKALALVQAAGLLTTPPLILPLPQFAEVNGVRLCLVEAPPGLPHVYSLAGRYLTRVGGENRLLHDSALASLLLERGEAGFESRPAPDATLADLDPVAVENYIAALNRPVGESWERTLLAGGCLTQAAAGLVPTYAGILLFGRQPQRFVRSAEIILARYAGPQMGDEFARHDAQSTLPEQIRQGEAFINANMRRGMRIKGFAREETTEYPISVIREAIVNAVAHRDYAIRGEGIRVMMFSDRLEVYSPGRLPGHVTLDNLLRERFSRNGVIVQVLSDLGFVERLGYGIDRMVATMAEAGLPAPCSRRRWPGSGSRCAAAGTSW